MCKRGDWWRWLFWKKQNAGKVKEVLVYDCDLTTTQNKRRDGVLVNEAE